jgi:putative flippase GtrA
MRPVRRFWRFNAVGLGGFAVQLTVVAWLASVAALGPTLATAIAVEAAVLHNFFWHERWTWADRPAGARERLSRFARFHLTNGLISIAGNAAIVGVLTAAAGVAPIPANALAVAFCSLVNFASGDRLVFRSSGLDDDCGAALATTLGPRAARSSPTCP